MQYIFSIFHPPFLSVSGMTDKEKPQVTKHENSVRLKKARNESLKTLKLAGTENSQFLMSNCFDIPYMPHS